MNFVAISARFFVRLASASIRFLCGMDQCCRFEPTCTSYSDEAVKRHGAWQGMKLVIGRLLRCHPWGGQGWDPVPKI